MTRARDLANLAGSATVLATDSELAAIDLTNVTRIVPTDSNISVPGAPTSVSGTVLSSSSAVSFVAPTDNGGSTILSYTVISSPGNIKKSGTSSPITITGLTNGTAYTFTVKAHNIAGSSAASTASSLVTPALILDVNYLVVAGAGGAAGGGGGAGGLRSTVTATGRGGTLETALALTPSTNYTVTVGAGGTFGSNSGSNGANGSNSVFSTITSLGGGYGAGGGNTSRPVGGNGGCGGGAWLWNNGTATGRGTGTTSQGYDGGEINPGIAGNAAGGGGGGAGAQGGDATGGVDGGLFTGNQLRATGVAVAITGSSVTYSEGGRGYHSNGTLTHNAGSANTGRGGDGPGGGGAGQNGFAGGSGVVILSYPNAFTITIGAGLTGTTATNGVYKVTTLTAGTGNVSWV